MQKNIIFDLDGTLIDSADGIVEAFNYALARSGLPVQPAEDIAKFIGYPLEHMFGQYTNKDIDSLKNDFKEKAVQTIVGASKPLDGAHEAVMSLFESGFELGIATTKIRSHLDGILGKLGWKDCFAEVIGGDEVTKVKPDPEMFSSLMTLMKAQPRETVIVGDTINDIIPAKKLSITSVAVMSPYGDSEEVKKLKPDFFIEKLSQLPKVIDEIFSESN